LAGINTWNRGGSLPEEAEDGLLTAEDVAGMDLSDTELVVLSACETGLGQVHLGEGVFGLRRAFMLAGARTLVMSLWQVPDQQTQQLMLDFYQRLLAGQSRVSALREAQLALKKQGLHPYYWVPSSAREIPSHCSCNQRRSRHLTQRFSDSKTPPGITVSSQSLRRALLPGR
jgi:CHAT domain-containing protein